MIAAILAFVLSADVCVQDEGINKGCAPYVNCTGAGLTCSVSGKIATINGSGGGGGGYATVQDEGVSLTARTTLNFTGAGVTCADNGGSSRTDCTIAGGGGGGTSPLILTFGSF
jgi:hypothetical protein